MTESQPLRARPRRRILHFQPFVWGAVLLVLAVLAGVALKRWQMSQPRAGGERALEGLGNFGTVPDFALTERSGRRVTRADLQWLVWVANFFYTTCPDTCPLQSAKMARLQQDFADDRAVRLVSISVDPEHDTPEILQDYARRFGADPERWLFLTGDKTAIYRLAQEGFHLSVVDPGTVPSQAPEASPQGAPSGSRSGLQSGSREARRLLPGPRRGGRLDRARQARRPRAPLRARPAAPRVSLRRQPGRGRGQGGKAGTPAGVESATSRRPRRRDRREP